MEAIRRIVTLKNNLLEVLLPDQYRNKTVELIILPADDDEIPKKKFDFSQLAGKLNSGLTKEEIDDQFKAIRNEWNRNI